MWRAFLKNILNNEDIDEINRIINNVILDKFSFLEVDIKEKNEDTNEKIKNVKEITQINRKLNDESIEKLTDEVNENHNDIEELINITQQLQQSNENENRKLKVVLLKTTKGVVKMINNQTKTINLLKEENRMMNEKIDLIFELLKDNN